MTLTLDEIVERKEHLRQEILERECLLAALEVLHKHFAAGRGAKKVDISALFPALRTPARAELLPEDRAALPETTTPPEPPPKPYMHPDLEQIGSWHGANTRLVQWAITHMTGDYTLQDLVALLKREGRPIQPAEVSVVLTRLKRRGKIKELRLGSGRIPALFGNPQTA